MGANSVEYHRDTVMERADDQPGSAHAYYASRGETPMRWGGAGAKALGLEGIVTDAAYEAIFGPGGAAHPTTGARLVGSETPGMELVVSAHKSVAELGVIGLAEDMHAVLDAERDATLAYLEDVTRRVGGRRGREMVLTPTSGLVYAVTRHATSRAGDPCPHDHVLLANMVEMLDAKGGWKAAHTALWRDYVHAATIAGRWASAQKARELGYAVTADRGPSGRLGHWAIRGVPQAVMDMHSKRAAQITEAVEELGYSSYQARGIAAVDTRQRKPHLGPEQLGPRWESEVLDAGWGPSPAAAAELHALGADPQFAPRPLDPAAVAAELLGPGGRLSERKVFTERDVLIAVGTTQPESYGVDAAGAYQAVARVLKDPDAIALLGRTSGGERPHSTATIVANEQSVAAAVDTQAARITAAKVHPMNLGAAVLDKTRQLGRNLTVGQLAAVQGICQSGRGVDLVEGVAGSGKTTVMAVARQAFEAEGYTVIGTATSGQAARTLGREAGIGTSRTLASLRWRLDHDQIRLDGRTVVIHDEAGMTDDADVAALLGAAGLAGAKVVMVGDDRQLGAIGSGGALGALIERHGGAVYRLTKNVRQQDPGEREALEQLRGGHVAAAVDWYLANGRVVVEATHGERLDRMVDGWAGDALAGKDAAMFCYRRRNVADLNARARVVWEAAGRLSGPELVAPGGAGYRAGDRIVTLASGAGGQVVTSERGTVLAVDPAAGAIRARMEDGRTQDLVGDDIGAEHLAHGYAITVHRSQGATVEVAHTLEDGGGRELAYVRMSRARQSTHVYLALRDPEQAGADLRQEWSREKRWLWAIDTHPVDGQPDDSQPDDSQPAGAAGAVVAAPVPPALRRAQLVIERAAVTAAIPPDPVAEVVPSAEGIHRARQALDDLKAGRGDYADTPAGAAARDLAEAKAHRDEARRMAESPGLRRRERRDWADSETRWAHAQTDAQGRWDRYGKPEQARLTAALTAATDRHGELLDGLDDRRRWLAAHPELPRLLKHIDSEIRAIDADLDGRRRGLDTADTSRPGARDTPGHPGWGWADPAAANQPAEHAGPARDKAVGDDTRQPPAGWGYRPRRDDGLGL